MNVGGKRLVNTILENIDRADVFACDLTYLNHNVSFELGYAIGRFKRVWITLDTSIEGAEHTYRRVHFGLLGSGYVEYNNSNDLISSYLEAPPVRDLDQTLLGELHRRQVGRQEDPVLLYVKPPISSDSVISAQEALGSSVFGKSLVIDDPVENPSPGLEWYAEKLGLADAVLCHLLGSHQKGHSEHNVKCSLVAGVAHGFRKSMLMLVQNPFESPIDYEALLDHHDTASECKQRVSSWIQRQADSLPRRRRRRVEGSAPGRQSLDLRNLAIGEPVAENERQRLDSYFVETSTYYRAMDDPVTIVIGRRGVGKSAQVFAMQAAMSRDRHNHVCVIKPVGYELDGLVRVLRSISSRSERGYLIESLWKFLIYSEVAQSTYSAIKDRPLYLGISKPEADLVEYYDRHAALLAPPFSERLDLALRSLADIGGIEDAVDQRRRISEQLHAAQLRELREILGKALSDYAKVSILIDNLDAQWGANEHVDPVSGLLWGLLQVSDDIVSEFRVSDHWRASANVNVSIFLRSDIFAFIQPTAPEQDKLPIQRIIWDDPDVLRRLIDQRIEFGGTNTDDPQIVWERLFPNEVVGRPTWDFLIETVLPRPRDIIYLIREAIDGAINRGHLSVTEQDLLDARDRYSEYVLRSISAEDDPRKGLLERILFEFAGCTTHITRSQIESRFEAAGVAPEDHEFYLDLLCDVNFLGIATSDGYQYARHEADRAIKRRIAGQIAKGRGVDETFRVSSAFWQVLQTEQAGDTR